MVLPTLLHFATSEVARAEAKNRNYEPSKRRFFQSLDVQSVVPKNAARRVVPIQMVYI